MHKEKISFVIPCYRSENTISDVVDEIVATVQKTSYDYEVVLVNDGSPDNTLNKIKDIVVKHKNIVAVNLAKNFGQHAALMAGFQYVSGDLVVCLDDDGQTPPSECLKLIDKLNKGFDAVYASYESKKHSVFRNLGSAVNERMLRLLLNKPKSLKVSSYFIVKKFIIDEIKKYESPFPYVLGLVLRTTDSIANVNVEHKKRVTGESGYTLKTLLALWLNGFTAFSIKPLRISSYFGLLCAGVGFVYAIFIIVRRLLDPTSILMGWSSMMAALTIIGGMILFVLGLLGEYIGRIYLSLNKSPQYVVKECIKSAD
ncbi:MAG: glycosyltransferase family 2 protein [Oscillospiraceae bacterium]|nr:glycosyltransferase family 2 protein [Oscillospiraceae bacterium]MCL2279456.1 glycosyltransferase family 2 protein [Oscillospiraceae bacterium]